MRFNYYYNFKNNIRFFMNIEDLDYKYVNRSSWSIPFKFRIRKDYGEFRTLKIPNPYNFKYAYDYYQKELINLNLDFEKLENLDSNKRIEISYDLGEFKINSYDKNQIVDFNLLTLYDKLIRVDIKSYYNSIYTHYLLDSDKQEIDKALSHMNNGRTSGIIMGNYISLFLVETFSCKISKKFDEKLKESNIDSKFSYFSDDFYIFVNDENVDKVISIFDKVLESFDLEKNENKLEIYDYLTYTEHDIIEKYWKNISINIDSQQRKHEIEIANGIRKYDSNLFFTNQLIYRLSKIENYKERKVFIVNFFKSKTFRNISFVNTKMDDYNFHQICFLIKEYPEIILYVDEILSNFKIFKSNNFKNLSFKWFKKSLLSNFHDEQLYFFYLLYKNNSLYLIDNDAIYSLVYNSENELLISYFLKYNIFSQSFLDRFLEEDCKEHWLIYYNYYIYLNPEYDLENYIEVYLLNNKTIKSKSKNDYVSFYKNNLVNKNEILIDLNGVTKNINEYINKKNSVE